MGSWGGKLDKRSINEKPPKLDKKMWKEIQKIINIVNEKIFQLGLRIKKEKPRLMKRKGTYSRRNLVEKRFGQNKVLCNSSMESNCQLSTTIQAPWYSLHQGDRFPATHWLLTLELHWLKFLLIVSSLLPHLARFLARFVGRFCCHFVGSWIVGLATGRTKSRGTDVTLGFFEWSLWKVALTNTNNILKVAAHYLASTLTNTDDKAEDLAVHCQAYIYRSGNTSPIFYPSLKIV